VMWLRALTDPDAAAAAPRAAEASEQLEALGHVLEAADAAADAACLAELAGLPGNEWRERAQALYSKCSAVPLLDWLPTRKPS